MPRAKLRWTRWPSTSGTLGDDLQLGRDLDEDGIGTATVPASDIESLRVLAPKLVKSVRLAPASIIVSVRFPPLDIRLTPVIEEVPADEKKEPAVEDGPVKMVRRITVKLSNSAFEKVKETEIVQQLLKALNAGVAGRGRLKLIQVTPEGITVTAEPTKSDSQ